MPMPWYKVPVPLLALTMATYFGKSCCVKMCGGDWVSVESRWSWDDCTSMFIALLNRATSWVVADAPKGLPGSLKAVLPVLRAQDSWRLPAVRGC